VLADFNPVVPASYQRAEFLMLAFNATIQISVIDQSERKTQINSA